MAGNPSVSLPWLLSVSQFNCYEDAQRCEVPTTDEEKALPDAVIISLIIILEGGEGSFFGIVCCRRYRGSAQDHGYIVYTQQRENHGTDSTWGLLLRLLCTSVESY